MTRKNFEELAKQLAYVRPQGSPGDPDFITQGDAYRLWYKCCLAVARACGLDNDQFDDARFLDACNA